MRTRPTTADELLVGFTSSLRNLSSSCEQFSRQIDDIIAERSTAAGGPPLTAPTYDHGPIIEIAARLRLLLGPGRGDELFRRVCAATGTAVPTIGLSDDAAFHRLPWDKVLIEYLSTGALPVGDGLGQATPVTDIAGRTCLALVEPGEPAVEYTWVDLVKEVGDKAGVHLDDDRPLVWDFLNQFHFGEIPEIPLLLYRLAVAVVRAGNSVLEALGVEPVPVGPTNPAAARSSAGMVVRSRKRPGPRPRRNDRCPCESGKKFKRCCGP
jgi:hypothetical protein